MEDLGEGVEREVEVVGGLEEGEDWEEEGSEAEGGLGEAAVEGLEVAVRGCSHKEGRQG